MLRHLLQYDCQISAMSQYILLYVYQTAIIAIHGAYSFSCSFMLRLRATLEHISHHAFKLELSSYWSKWKRPLIWAQHTFNYKRNCTNYNCWPMHPHSLCSILWGSCSYNDSNIVIISWRISMYLSKINCIQVCQSSNLYEFKIHPLLLVNTPPHTGCIPFAGNRIRSSEKRKVKRMM